LAGMWNNAPKSYSALWKDVFQSLVVTLTSKLTRFNMRNRGNGPVSGTLYIASMIAEENPFIKFARKLKDFLQIVNHKTQISYEGSVLSTNSSSTIFLSENSLNYIFVDPPFGANLMYSELNFLWEAWLGVFTNNEPEAVINKTQRKGLAEYQALMEACFGEFYRVLKPGRWMTVEFHNSQNAVWNAIQEALLRAGFMVADVRTLDKKQGTFKQVTTTSAVKQDLIISAYKPAAEFERRFLAQGGSADAAWDFIRQHLEQLPMPALKDGVVEFIEERAPYLLYDRMVAFHVQRGLAVPLSAAEFYAGLRERFAERDGMFFTFLQSAEYDRRRLQAERVEQLALFVSDEKSAVQWLRRELQREPQTYQELHPRFIRELHQAAYEAMPELKTILEENFLQDERGRWYLPDPGRESDLQALREKSLLREFGLYLKGRGKLKSFRLEAVRAGFSRAWKDRQYETILEVAARLPERALEDDPQLLMYVDNARLRAAAQPKQERLI
ncbi:MAG: hypothetical protein WHV66_14890, partial [Anaerolineales bacterium]